MSGRSDSMLKASFRSPGRRGSNLKNSDWRLNVRGSDACVLVSGGPGGPPLGFQSHPAVVRAAGEAFPAEGSFLFIRLQEELLGYVQNAIHLHKHTRREVLSPS